MTAQLRRFVCKVVICALFLMVAVKPASAGHIPTQSDVVWIGVAIAAIGAGIGIGIYYAVHHGNSLNGCANSGADGLQLLNSGDGQTYSLSGDTAAIKPGEHVRVLGKKSKTGSGSAHPFFVEKVGKDYGACKVQPATP